MTTARHLVTTSTTKKPLLISAMATPICPAPTDNSKQPLTFVTYEIIERLTENLGSKREITLKFLGGPSDDARFMRVSHSPLFNEGDEDIVFVRNNWIH